MGNAGNAGCDIFYPLTHPQKRIWYVEKLYPGTSLYNIGGYVRVKGPVDFNLLEESIHIFIRENEGLRLKLIEKNGEVYQFVSEYKKLKLDFFDFSVFENPEKEFKTWVDNEAGKPFEMINKNLFYFAMFKISENDNGYFIKTHHIISDGWSINILTTKISEFYMNLIRGENTEEKSEISYLSYVNMEREYLASEKFLSDKMFWNKEFEELPEKFLERSSNTTKGKRSTFLLDESVSMKIKNFVSESKSTINKCSINTFFVSLFLLYVYKIKQQKNIVIGTPVLNRSDKSQRNIFGMFTSTVPFRIEINSDWNMLKLMESVCKKSSEYYRYQKYPYDLLVQDLELNKKGYDGLFKVCVNYYNTKHVNELNGAPVENVEAYNGNQAYSLQLVIKDWRESGGLILDFDYKVDDYTKEQIQHMFSHLMNLAEQIIDKPEEKIENLSCLSYEEVNEVVYEFNRLVSKYPGNKTIYQLFEEQAQKTPDKIAVVYRNESLTYRELNEKSNQLARFLMKKGIGRETIVGIMVTHSIEMVIGILGIIKSGGAYLPVDPEYPMDRINYLINDSGMRLLLTNCDIEKNIEFTGKIFRLDDKKIYEGDFSNLEVQNKSNDLVYIIYTSGSTGKPKGVMIEHQGLVNYVWWAKKMYVKSEEDSFALYSSLSFDLTVTSVFTPLIGGNKIYIYRDDGVEYVLYKIINDNKASIVKLTPAHLSLFKDRDNGKSSVKRFIVGGEDLKTNLAAEIHESFNGNIEIYNEYGPTETVVGCMIHKYSYECDKGTSVPIGIPADNVQIYILDKNLRPVPKGCLGQIYISGDGIARGYLKRPGLSEERFINNPFIIGKRMYKTGDLARHLFSGVIEYAGRIDHQVKIRGYRIEPGEIEKHLLDTDYVKEAVVIDREDTGKNKYLCAYVVPAKEFKENDLKQHLSKSIPQYMIPSYIVALDSLPLTQNGKVNRASLPEPRAVNADAEKYIAPQNEPEKKLVSTIQDVLNLNKIGMNDNFYRLGGDSIKAIQIASKLREKGFNIKVKDILSNSIIKEMALCLEDYQSNQEVSQEPRSGFVELTPINAWFFSQQFIDFNYYNQSVNLIMKKNIDKETLQGALTQLIWHHDALRLNYNEQTGKLFFNENHINKMAEVSTFNLSKRSDNYQDLMMAKLGEEIKSSFDIRSELLFKACIFDLGLRGKRLLLTAHHLVVDGVSWRILLEDLVTLLSQKTQNKDSILPKKTQSIQKWSLALSEYSRKRDIDEKKYWGKVLKNNITVDTDHILDEGHMENLQQLYRQMTEEESINLLNNVNYAYGTQTSDILVISLVLAIRDYFNRDTIVLELEGHGREEIFADMDISRTVGWFTIIYPALFRVDGEDLTYQIKSLKEQLREIPTNGFGYGILKYLSKEIDPIENKYIRFNYLGDFDNINLEEYFEISNENTGPDSSKRNELACLIDINALIIGGRLEIRLTFSKHVFWEKSMHQFLDLYIDKIKLLIKHCTDKEAREFTPSDFETVDFSQDALDNLFF